MKKRNLEPTDIIPEWKRHVVGNSARLDIPLDNIYLLRKVGPVIAGMAEHIKFTAQRTDISEYDILLSIRHDGIGQHGMHDQCAVLGLLVARGHKAVQSKQVQSIHGLNQSANLKRRNHGEPGAGCQIGRAA